MNNLVRPGLLRCRGFSAVEIVAGMVLLSILSVFGYSRFVDRPSLAALGFFEELKGGVRYAQALALAKRRTVCITTTATAFSLTYAPAEGAGAACTLAVSDPALQSGSFQRSAPEGVGLTAVTLRFDSSGQPVDAAGVPLNGAVTFTQADGEAVRTLTVEARSGFVHS